MKPQLAGTIANMVTLQRFISLKNFLTLAKVPSITTVAPLVSAHLIRPSPNEWLTGSAKSSTSSAVFPINSLIFRAAAARFKYDRATPFGTPVVPVVKRTSAISFISGALNIAFSVPSMTSEKEIVSCTTLCNVPITQIGFVDASIWLKRVWLVSGSIGTQIPPARCTPK